MKSSPVNISILLATFNGARFLPELLQSLVSQTYRPLEIICCDDASEDQTVALLNDFSRKNDIPVKVHTNSVRKGYRKNFWDGIHLCNGDFVAFCDQDDVWKEQKLERFVSRITSEMTPSLVFSDSDLVDCNLIPLHMSALEFSGLSRRKRERICAGELLEVLLKHPLVPGMSMMVHKERAQVNAPCNRNLMHDYALSSGFAIGADYAFIDERLVLYRQHSSNAIGMNPAQKNKKKKRGSVWMKDYSQDVNSDLASSLIILKYLERFHTRQLPKTEGHLNLIKSQIDLALFREKRRNDFKTLLLKEIDFPPLQITNKEKRRLWLKDFRSLIRLVISSFVRKMIANNSNLLKIFIFCLSIFLVIKIHFN